MVNNDADQYDFCFSLVHLQCVFMKLFSDVVDVAD